MTSFLTSFRPEVREYEKQIDRLVYGSTEFILSVVEGLTTSKLYGLTPEEIKIVESNK